MRAKIQAQTTLPSPASQFNKELAVSHWATDSDASFPEYYPKYNCVDYTRIAAMIDVVNSDSDESQLIGRLLLNLRAGKESGTNMHVYNANRKMCDRHWRNLVSLASIHSVNTHSRLDNLFKTAHFFILASNSPPLPNPRLPHLSPRMGWGGWVFEAWIKQIAAWK